LAWVTPLLLDMVVGIVTGALVLGVVLLVKKVMGKH
jgi:predicted DNA repair protein MutK